MFYSGIIDGYYLVADLSRDGYSRIAELNRQFADLELGFVDAAVVAIAENLGLQRVATTDRRHFEPVARALKLELLPSAAPNGQKAATDLRPATLSMPVRLNPIRTRIGPRPDGDAVREAERL